MTTRINPSILAADFANLEHELGRIATADLVHVDVMDNHFVPNLTFGLQMVRAPAGGLADPARRAPHDRRPRPVGAGLRRGWARTRSRSTPRPPSDPVALARALRELGARAGIAAEARHAMPTPYLDLLPEFDQVLVMTVEPGFGGQSFMPETMPKLRRVADAVRDAGLDVWLQVDGGITADDHRHRRRGGRRHVRRRLGGVRRRRCRPSASRRCATPRRRTRTRHR